MNINNINQGQIFKNYKELCLELEWEIKSGTDSKNAQFKELARYCKFNKSGRKFIIEEVYETPLPKIENRGKSEGSRNNNTVYGDMIQLLVLDLLAQCKDGNLSISRGKLMLAINMINKNYSPLGEQTKKLSMYTEIEEQVIYDFYNTTNSNFKNAVETALKTLMDKRIIWFEIVTKVSEMGNYKTRLATQEEIEIVRDSEKAVLIELGYRKVSDVRTSRHWRLFKSKVKTLLNKESQIDYYYFAYNINANEKYLQEERKELLNFLLEKVERNQYKGELNATINHNLIENAKKRQQKGFTSGKMSKYRSKEDYIENIAELVKLLINNKTSDIVQRVLNVDADDILTQTQMDEIEQLFS